MMTDELPVEPFRQWLLHKRKLYETTADLCEAIGMHERSYRRVMNEQPYVHIDLVDKTLLEEGNTMMWEIYPYDE